MKERNAKNQQKQHDEVLMDHIMAEYMEIEGARLHQEFEAADARGEVPDVPAELDAACRKLIQEHFEKKS